MTLLRGVPTTSEMALSLSSSGQVRSTHAWDLEAGHIHHNTAITYQKLRFNPLIRITLDQGSENYLEKAR